MTSSKSSGNDIYSSWNIFWFSKVNTVPLEIARIGLGITLCFLYFPLTLQDILYFYTNNGPIPLESIPCRKTQPYIQSMFYYITNTNVILTLHYLFLFSILFFLFGVKTVLFKWVCLIFHISYLHRNPTAFYGVDNILCNLMIILCVGPIGKTLSIDWIIEKSRKIKKGLSIEFPLMKSSWACACTRLLQIQMAVCFFYTGIKKLKGETWWSGEALWYALINFEFNTIPLDFFSNNMWLINILCYFTILSELSYPFLIWNKKLRPFLLGGAILLHFGIAIFLGLYLFSYTMIIGHISFIHRSTWLRFFKKMQSLCPQLEVIYDGNCGMCLSVINKITTIDILGQLNLRNFRVDPHPDLSFQQQNSDLFVVTKGKFIGGYKAYKYLVTRMPVLWFFIPLFYIPLLSNLLGERIYRWFSNHRMTISSCKTKYEGIK